MYISSVFHLQFVRSTMKRVDAEQKSQNLQIVLEWVKQRIRDGDIPRFSDVVDYARRERKFLNLSKKMIVEALRLEPSYLLTSKQQRMPHRANRNRPIICNSIGSLHCDIAYFPVRKEYETPPRFRNGVLFCKDVLTRMVFFEILKNKTTPELIRAFEVIDQQFKTHYPGEHIESISFDQERAIMAHAFQKYCKEVKHWKFFAFTNSSSKAKMAENVIGVIRADLKRYEIGNAKGEMRWWRLMSDVVASLNRKPIQIMGKFLKMENGEYYYPAIVNNQNLNHFISQLQKAGPAYFFSQFDISPRWVKYKFEVGQCVRVKLKVSSSAVLGEKRSEISLQTDVFEIKKRYPFVSKRFTIEKLYVCQSVYSEELDYFEEQDLALTVRPF